jgi:S1-C subfamily serine protease
VSAWRKRKFGRGVSNLAVKCAADDIGLRAGDIIIEVNRDRVQGLEDLQDKVDRKYQAGGTVEFTILRLYFQKGWRKAHLDDKLGG